MSARNICKKPCAVTLFDMCQFHMAMFLLEAECWLSQLWLIATAI